MAFNNQTADVLNQALRSIAAKQSLSKRKANTVTAAFGSALLIVAVVLTGVFAHHTNLPAYTEQIVPIILSILTVLGVSRTPNGVTDSVVDKINDELFNIIDDTEAGKSHNRVVAPAVIEAPEK